MDAMPVRGAAEESAPERTEGEMGVPEGEAMPQGKSFERGYEEKRD